MDFALRSLAVSLALAFLALSALVAVDARFVTMRQDSSRNGYFDVIDSTTGAVERHSAEAPIVFSWPYCEMTSDQQGQRVFAVVFPDNSNNSVLYQLNSELVIRREFPNTPYWFFDLQYSPKQDTLYGIKVTSTYGRVLSNFRLPVRDSEAVVATELFELPYMWYVNASTFDDDNNRYFALLNYFPGHPESTLSQKLLVSTMNGANAANANVLDIQSADIVQFVSYSKATKHLYFASISQDLTLVTVGILCPITAEVKLVLTTIKAFSVGPIAVDDGNGILTVFIKLSQGAAWTLYNVQLSDPAPAKAVYTYDHSFFTVFDAVARF